MLGETKVSFKGYKPVAKRNTSITINGKQYDALTGELLLSPVAPEAVKLKGKSIDGVVAPVHHPSKAHGPRQAAQAKAAPKRTTAQHATTTPKPAKNIDGITRYQAAHAKPRKSHASKTLMRHAVTKPKQTARKPKVQAPMHAASHAVTRVHAIVTPKPSIYSINQTRALRASAIAMHPRIAKFAHQLQYDLTVAAPAVLSQAVSALDQAIVLPTSNGAATINYKPDVSPSRNTATNDIFEQALKRATSHEQPAPVVSPAKRRKAGRLLRRRMLSFGAGSVAVVAIVGFLSFSSVDSVKFHVSTRSAGFAATMPNYTPSGYKMASIKSASGYVGVRYEQTTADGEKQAFVVAQKPTLWDNETLLTNVAQQSGNRSYAATNDGNRTVYTYGNGQAAWIRDGVLYQIVGSNNLQSNELVKIASSI